MTMHKWVFLFCLALLAGCGKNSSGYDYKIALDPEWYSLDLEGRDYSLTAFSIELIEAIGKEESLKIGVYKRSWSNLMLGLQENNYQAICTSLQPFLFYEQLYNFSDIYLATGAVLIGQSGAEWNALSQLSGKEIGILQGSPYALILEKYPEIIQKTYISIPSLLQDVQNKTIRGALLDILTALAYTKDLYQGQLKILSPPLTQEGIRLIGLQGKSDLLIKKFNRGLKKLKSNGTYSKIAQKWNVEEDKYTPSQ